MNKSKKLIYLLEQRQWFGVYGKWIESSGIFIIQADNEKSAINKIEDLIYKRRNIHVEPSEIQPAWEGIQSSIEDIKMGREEYYTDLGNSVYFVED